MGDTTIAIEKKRKNDLDAGHCSLPLRKRIHMQSDGAHWDYTPAPIKNVEEKSSPSPNHSLNSPDNRRSSLDSVVMSPDSSSAPIDIETVSDEDDSKLKEPVVSDKRSHKANGLSTESQEKLARPAKKGDRRRSSKQIVDDDEDISVVDESSSDSSDGDVYCFCRKPDHGRFMIACDRCDEWFHGQCVGITKEAASRIKNYVCDNCSSKDGPSHPSGDTKKSGERKKERKKQRKCHYLACINVCKPGSKYCCDECGILNAKETVKRKKMEELTLKTDTFNEADQDDFNHLQQLEKRKKSIADNIESIFTQKIEYEAAVLKASGVQERSDRAPPSEDATKCTSCSEYIQSKQYQRHLETCEKVSHRQSKGGGICGCPSTEYSIGYCQRGKKTCEKHVNWENIRRAQLEQERNAQVVVVNGVLEEERAVLERITRRHSSAERSMHTVVCHSQGS